MARSKKPVLPGLSRSTACGTKSCARLKGHNGEHRLTLTKSAPTVAAPKVVPASAKKVTRRPKVRTLPFEEPKRRLGTGGRSARRPKAAPASTRSNSNAGALKGRMVPLDPPMFTDDSEQFITAEFEADLLALAGLLG